jgi:hypothetical protein
VIDRIVAETAGNPLALLELPRGMTPAELAGGPGFGGTAGLPGRIEDSFRRRLELLPGPTRRLVLVAAAGPAGDAALLWRACALAGIDPGAAGPAQDAGLVQVGARVRFFRPLVRSAVFRAASAQERPAHGLLAAATDAAADPGQRAWHRAQAAPGPGEQVAGELEDSAGLARARGGVAAAAAFLERAAALTLDPQRRSARALAAAQAWHQAGGHDLAVELAEVAEAGPLGELGRARAGWLRAQIIFVRTGGRDGTVQLLRAAQRLDPLDRDLARATYAGAVRAADLSGDMLEAGRRPRALPLSQPPDATGLLLHGYGLFVTEGFPRGLDVLGQAIDAFVSAPVTADENIRALEAAAAARYLQDDTGFDVLTARGVALARQAGALSLLPEALDYRALYCVDAGELAGAAAALDEAEAIRQATGMEPGSGGDSGLLAALREEERTATGHIGQLRREPGTGGVSRRAARLEHALAVLYNGLARYPEALAAAQRPHERHLGTGGLVQPLAELAEAAVRCRQPEAAQTALRELCAHTRLGRTDWGRGLKARSRALLAGGAAAGQLYTEATGRPDPDPDAAAAGPRPPALRRMAAPPAAHRPPPVRGDGRPVVRRPGPAGTDRDRRHRAQPPQRHPG